MKQKPGPSRLSRDGVRVYLTLGALKSKTLTNLKIAHSCVGQPRPKYHQCLPPETLYWMPVGKDNYAYFIELGILHWMEVVLLPLTWNLHGPVAQTKVE